jgi:hypothetical protein
MVELHKKLKKRIISELTQSQNIKILFTSLQLEDEKIR